MATEYSELQVGSPGMMPVTEVRDGAAGLRGKSDTSLLQVVVVDDNAPVLRFLQSAFSTNGCLVTTASSAEEALDLLSDHPFDLVVSDIKMPGLSGLDLLRAVKSKQPGTPVVLITGVPSVNSAVFGLRHGAYDYLPKPFSVKEVQQLLQRLRKDRAQGSGRLSFPAGLTEELARRQFGMEALSRIGELALQSPDPGVFVDSVLDYTIQALRSDAALVLLRDQDGHFTPSQKGHPSLSSQLLSLLHAAFEELVKTGGKEALSLTGQADAVAAIAALIPGTGKAMGVLCLGRDAKVTGAFLPDEKEFLVGYAQTTALALQKIFLRENLESNLIDTIASFVTALESKDPYLKGHSARVSMYAGEIALGVGMTPAQVSIVRRAGLLHDLGKLVVLDSVLHKPGRLTKEEYALVMRHPLVADKILKPLRFLAQEAKAIRHHHERWDGKGLPDGLKGEEIPLAARIVTVADSYDAMTSTRAYRSALPIEVAISEILRGAKSQFDPTVTEAFASIPRARLAEISRYYSVAQVPVVSEQAAAVEAPVGETHC